LELFGENCITVKIIIISGVVFVLTVNMGIGRRVRGLYFWNIKMINIKHMYHVMFIMLSFLNS